MIKANRFYEKLAPNALITLLRQLSMKIGLPIGLFFGLQFYVT